MEVVLVRASSGNKMNRLRSELKTRGGGGMGGKRGLVVT